MKGLRGINGKHLRAVLRGLGASNGPRLPGGKYRKVSTYPTSGAPDVSDGQISESAHLNFNRRSYRGTKLSFVDRNFSKYAVVQRVCYNDLNDVCACGQLADFEVSSVGQRGG